MATPKFQKEFGLNADTFVVVLPPPGEGVTGTETPLDDESLLFTKEIVGADPHTGAVPVTTIVPPCDSAIPLVWHTLDGTPARVGVYSSVLQGMGKDSLDLYIMMAETIRIYDATAQALLSLESGFASQMKLLGEEEALFRHLSGDETTMVETFSSEGSEEVNITREPGRLRLGVVEVVSLPPALISVEATTEVEFEDAVRVPYKREELSDDPQELKNPQNDEPYRAQVSTWEGRVVTTNDPSMDPTLEFDTASKIRYRTYFDKGPLPWKAYKYLKPSLLFSYVVETPADRFVNAVRLKTAPETPPTKMDVLLHNEKVVATFTGSMGHPESGEYTLVLNEVVPPSSKLFIRIERTIAEALPPITFDVDLIVVSYRGTRIYTYDLIHHWPGGTWKLERIGEEVD